MCGRTVPSTLARRTSAPPCPPASAQIYDHSIRVNFNMTMLRLPCQYVNLDVFDVMGASVHNVTRGVFRHRVLANGVRADFKPQKRPKSWQRSMGARADARPPSARELNVTTAQVEGVTHIDAEGFGPFLRARPHALVLFGAAWCPWTSDLLPTWADVERRVRADARLGQQLAVGYLDCARPEVRPVCKAHFVQAFPSVHLYQHNETSVHQNYVGPRAPEPLLEFARAAVEHTARSSLATPFHANGVHGAHGFEGCGLSGAFYVARVPGSLRISAHSDAHSLNPAWIDMDHHVDALTFGVPDTKERLHHEKALQKLLEESEGLSAPALEAHERRGLTVRARRARHRRVARARLGPHGPPARPGPERASRRHACARARPRAVRCAAPRVRRQDPFEHIDDLAFLPQHSAGSVVRPFRPGKRKASRFERFVSMVERLKHKQAKVGARGSARQCAAVRGSTHGAGAARARRTHTTRAGALRPALLCAPGRGWAVRCGGRAAWGGPRVQGRAACPTARGAAQRLARRCACALPARLGSGPRRSAGCGADAALHCDDTDDA